MTTGPVQLIVVDFAKPEYMGKILPGLRALPAEGAIRLLDMLAVRKDEKGKISSVQMSDLTQGEAMRYGALVGGLIGWRAAGPVGAWKGARAGVEAVAKHETGFTDENIRRIVDEIPKGHVAVIALIEHRWLSQFRQAITDAGADFFAEGMITPEALVKLGAELAAAGAD